MVGADDRSDEALHDHRRAARRQGQSHHRQWRRRDGRARVRLRVRRRDGRACAWRFYTVPGNPADGFETPELETRRENVVGRVVEVRRRRHRMGLDGLRPELDLLYIGVGNGSPWNHQIRSNGEGDNLFLSSIVALKPDTGKYVWHFQSTPARDLGLHRDSAHRARRSHDRRQDAQGADAGAEERLLLCASIAPTANSSTRRTTSTSPGRRGLDPKTGRPQSDSRSALSA